MPVRKETKNGGGVKRSKGRKIEAEFSGGNITSDGGILLLKMADQKIGLTKKVASVVENPRDQNKCDYDQITMLRQRIFGLALYFGASIFNSERFG